MRLAKPLHFSYIKMRIPGLPRGNGMGRLLVGVLLCLWVAPESGPTPRCRAVLMSSEPVVIDHQSVPLPTPEQFALLAKTNPVAMLEAGLIRYQREVTGYRCTLVKRERIAGKLQPREVIDASFSEQPFSVLMRWREGGGLTVASLFVDGENQNRLTVRRRFLTLDLHPDDERVRATSRYHIRDFGIYRGMERTFLAWSNAQRLGQLRFKYLGEQNVPELLGRRCYVIRRTCFTPEEDGITEVTIYIDVVTWLQVGVVLKAGNELVGEYFFREVQLSPQFSPDEFKRSRLK